MRQLKTQVWLRDALYNFSPRSGASEEYCKGLLVGVVSALVATGVEWRAAITHAAINMPEDARIGPDTVPESWGLELMAEYAASHKGRRG